MAKLVIDIPDEIVEKFSDELISGAISTETNNTILDAVCRGTFLPKRHGRLKDIDKIINDGISKGFCDWYDEMKNADTVIEGDNE